MEPKGTDAQDFHSGTSIPASRHQPQVSKVRWACVPALDIQGPLWEVPCHPVQPPGHPGLPEDFESTQAPALNPSKGHLPGPAWAAVPSGQKQMVNAKLRSARKMK